MRARLGPSSGPVLKARSTGWGRPRQWTLVHHDRQSTGEPAVHLVNHPPWRRPDRRGDRSSGTGALV